MIFKTLSTSLLVFALNVSAVASTESAISETRERITQSPELVEPHIKLAQLLAKRGRETSEHIFYEQALDAANTALELAPQNIAASRAKIWALLGKHEFSQARELAVKLNKRAPDDILTYAFLVDANVELGYYQDAEEAAQWLLDMRPGSIAGLARAAYLRELFGDLEGSALLLTQALEKTPSEDPEQHAWLLVHLSQVQLQLGRVELAEKIANYALNIYPAYHYALRTLVDIAARKRNETDAVAFAKHYYETAAHPENLFILANALKQAGQREAAEDAFKTFAKEALAEADGWDNANRELTYYLIDEANEVEKALQIAEREYGRRQDVFTKTAYAWALLAAGNTDSAWQLISEVLAVGTRSPEIVLRAGFIAHQAGKLTDAKQYLRQGIEGLPLHALAPKARNRLTELLANESLTGQPG